jgi:hypothetical protein
MCTGMQNGRGRDPEVRHTQSNQKIVHLAVATSERWKDRQSGEARERTEWHRVAPGGDLRRALGRDRRALPVQGQPGLPRGHAADLQAPLSIDCSTKNELRGK